MFAFLSPTTMIILGILVVGLVAVVVTVIRVISSASQSSGGEAQRKEIALLRAEVERLREEIERLTPGASQRDSPTAVAPGTPPGS